MIRIKRRSRQYADRLRSYEVVLDGNVVCHINMGEVFEYHPLPGAHTLQLKIDWCRSAKLDFEIQDNEVMDFECGGLSGYKLWFVLWMTIFQRNRYLWLKKIGTYSVSDSPSLTNENVRFQNLLQAGPKWKFVFRHGVLGWGITTGIVVQIIHVFTGTNDSLIDWAINLALFMVGGLCWGLILRPKEILQYRQPEPPKKLYVTL